MPTQTDPNTNQPLDQSVVTLAKSIRNVESNDRYDAVGASGEHGAYQFMPKTWQSWAGQYLGDSNASMNPINQDKVAYYKIQDLKNQGYNPEQVASLWNSGSPDPTNNVGTNSKGVSYDTPKYVNSVMNKYQQFRQGIQGGQTLPNPSQALPAGSPDPSQPEEKSVGGFIENAIGSAGNVVGNIANTIFHPIQAVQGIVNAIKNPSIIGKMLKDRYGSLQNIEDTLYKDPVSVALDVSTVLGGVGALGKLGAEGGELAKLGQLATRAGELTNPLHGVGELASKTLGKTADVTSNKLMNMGLAIPKSKAGAGVARFALENNQGFKTESGLANFAKRTEKTAQTGIEPALQGLKASEGTGIDLAQTANKVVKDFSKFKKTNFTADQVLKGVRKLVKGHEYIVDQGVADGEDANALRQGLDLALKSEKGKIVAGPLPMNQQLSKSFLGELRSEIQTKSGTQAEFAQQSGAIGLKKAIGNLQAKHATQGRPGLLDVGGYAVGGVHGVIAERLLRDPYIQRLTAQGIFNVNKLAGKLAKLAPAERLKYLNALSQFSSAGQAVQSSQ